MNEPRVLQVCAVDFTAYHLLAPLMRACRDSGWITEFACADGPGANALRAEGFTHRPIPMSRSASPPRQLRAAAALTRSLRSDSPDLVHTHTPVGGLVGRVAARLAGVPTVHTFHGLPFVGRPAGIAELGLIAIERILAGSTAHFFSQASGDAVRATQLGIARAADLTIIGNGVQLGRFEPSHDRRHESRRRLGLADGNIAVLTVARLVREKGLLDLADAAMAFAADSDVTFLIAGSALVSDRTSIASELSVHPVGRKLGPRWRLLGARDDVPALLAAADIFVLPSYREGLPRSIIEAMASGLPVIATDIPACKELVEDEVNGLLVKPGDVAALSTAIARLASDERLRDAFGRVSLERARREHDEGTILELQIKILRRVIGN